VRLEGVVLVGGLNQDAMTREENAARMLAHVAAQAQSGTSRKAYCEQQGLKLCILNYWVAKHRRRAGPEGRGFAPIEVSGGSAMELHYPNGVRLLLPTNTALKQVAAFIGLY
jgi:hypothetical protein